MKVDGFEEKGSFKQMVHYYAPYQMMEALINRSVSCVQKLGYRCKRSKESNTNIPG